MNIESLSLDQMRTALIVAEAGSFSGAARRLNRKQSAVSYAISTLERQLGLAIFDRSDGQRPVPTAVGTALLREMEAVVRSADEIKKKAQAAAQGLETEVSMAVDSFYPAAELVAVLHGFGEQFPTVPLRVEIESMGGVQKSVIDGTCVLGIAGSYPHLPPGLIGDAVTQITRVPVASPRHPLTARPATGKRFPGRTLLDHIQIVVSDRSELTRGRDFAVYTGRTWRVSELAVKRDLLIAGLGWGYMPEHLVANDLATGVLRILHVEGLRDRNVVSLMAIRRRDRLLGPAAQWILSRLLTNSTTRNLQGRTKKSRRANLGAGVPQRTHAPRRRLKMS
jgi:DNA-binding transcriptional LysR family regulator